jgi:glycosyltransferase involved in cell wall biosynthesis
VGGAEAKDESPTLRSPIVYFGNDWSAENRTSSHHVARWLARRTTVVYFESPGLRSPRGSPRDLRKVARKVFGFLRGPRRQPEGLWLETLLQIPLHRSALARRINRALLRATVRSVMRRLGIRRPIAWFVVPHVGALVGHLGERLSVYYCIDDYAALPDVDEVAVREMDEELTRKADVLFAASAELLARKRTLNADCHLSPHGVDVAHFAKAQDPELKLPDDVSSLPRPIVGFFGLIEQWIDLDLVEWLAAKRPLWTFLMIGRVAVDEGALPRRPNVHFAGPRPYESLPAYGKAFDAAILPYRITPQVLAANPLKLREYLAMGKPVVAVSTPETDRFGDLVAIARSREDFLAALDRAMSSGLSPQQRQAQTEAVSGMTWDANLSKVLKVVDDRLAVAPR